MLKAKLKRYIAYFMLALLVCAACFACSCADRNPPDKKPIEGTAETEIFILSAGPEYVKSEDGLIFQRYTDAANDVLVAVIQIKSTGTLTCDYKLKLKFAEDAAVPSGYENIKVKSAQFLTAPEVIKDTLKNDSFEVISPLADINGKEIARGALKAGYADYYAVVIALPAEAKESDVNALITAITASTENAKHTETEETEL